MDAIHHRYWVIGRSLVRTFLAGATKDAAICLVSEEQAQKKKLSLNLVLSKRMITFETMSRSYSRSKILKKIWYFAHLFVTLH